MGTSNDFIFWNFYLFLFYFTEQKNPTHSVAHMPICATEIWTSVAHIAICATELWPRTVRGGPPQGIMWRMYQHAPHNFNLLWRMWAYAPQNSLRPCAVLDPAWAPWRFCGASVHMRHRKAKFCGAPVLHAPQKLEISVEHIFWCATEIILWSTHF